MTLTWTIASSLFVYPHSLSYFNELVGGPRGGQWHLADSNVDWAQDYYYLERWYCQHPEARPLHCALGPSMVNPSLVGIEAETIPRGPVMNRLGAPATRNWPWNDIAADSPRAANDSSSPGPVPGWFAVSVNGIHEPDGRYEYFLNFEPTTSIGYSTMIYFITLDEANQFRRELGMEQLAPERNSGS